MRPEVWVVFRKELLETLRDRRTLLVMILVPVLLYPGLLVLTEQLAIFGAQRLADEESAIAMVGEPWPELEEWLSGREGLRLDSVGGVEDAGAAVREDRVRAVVSRIGATGRAASAASAASGFFIPGPIGLRVPGTLGGLAAEAELLAANDQGQAAAILWSRDAQAVGTDNPSLSRVGDAVQLAEPFGDAVGDAFSPEDREVRAIADPGPCARFGPRFRPEGVAAGFLTGLYSPELSGAQAEDDEPEEVQPDR